jgi:hypothetical protein
MQSFTDFRLNDCTNIAFFPISRDVQMSRSLFKSAAVECEKSVLRLNTVLGPVTLEFLRSLARLTVYRLI